VSPRGQSLVELAVALPAVLALALGTGAIIRLADAKSGLDGATAAAVADAARQTSAATASQCAQTRFAAIIASYPLIRPVLTAGGTFRRGTFNRGSWYVGTSSAGVDLSFVPLWFIPKWVTVRSQARALVEPWRSRSQQPCGVYAVMN